MSPGLHRGPQRTGLLPVDLAVAAVDEAEQASLEA